MSRIFITTITAVTLLLPGGASAGEAQHAIAMHGAPKYSAGFTHFPYVNPAAPKGGQITLGRLGSFDSTNPLIVKGEPLEGIVAENVIESLLARGRDEAFTLYGLIAESIEVTEDRSAITFHLNPKARFADGAAITAGDVLFSWELLKEKGRPNYRTYYKKVEKAEQLSERSVRFQFARAEANAANSDPYDREMPLIMGLMPVLPKHKIDPEAFEKSTLEFPLGSGPYKISKIDPGRSVVLARDPDYWGIDLPVNRGRFNFDAIRYDYYREASAMFEAFKLGNIDLRGEDDPVRWAQEYRIPAVTEGRMLRTEIAIGLPAGMNALVFNTRREVFRDPKVRQALIQLYNFEWVNENLFNKLYTRTQSFFARSSLAALGSDPVTPADNRETQLLEPFPNAVKDKVRDGSYRFPIGDPSGHNRANAQNAFTLLKEAGYVLENGKLIHKASRQPFAFEIMLANSVQERLLSGFVGDLKRVGIEARLRTVDSAQYQSRLNAFDYDMIPFAWAASLSPGNEQLFRWSSASAKTPGSFNYAGVENPAVDAMIGALLSAKTQEDFVSAVRALDRVLLSGDYVIPLFYGPKQWIAHWKRLHHPQSQPLYGFLLDTWWIEDEKKN